MLLRPFSGSLEQNAAGIIAADVLPEGAIERLRPVWSILRRMLAE